MAGLARAGLAARTAARRLSALRQFHRFLLREGVRADDPTALLDAPQLPRVLPKYLSERRSMRCLAPPSGCGRAARRGRAGGAGDPVRDGTARVGAAGAAAHALAGDAAVLLIRGKGGKERIVPLSDAAKARGGGAGGACRTRRSAGCSPAAIRGAR